MFRYAGLQFFVDESSGTVTAYKVDDPDIQPGLSRKQEHAARKAALHQHGAMMYMWGRQDETDKPDTSRSLEFAEYYATLVYALGERGTCSPPPVAHIYQKWLTAQQKKED